MKTKIAVFCCFALFAVLTHAQVTIGSGNTPVSGALLQLKENDNTGVNATKGMLLPRVQLTGHDLNAIQQSGSESAQAYAGLVVWNTRGVGDICKGVNIWTGTKWNSVMPKAKDQTNFDATTGILTDHEGNTYTTSDFGTAGRWMTVNLRTKRSPGSCEDVYFAGEISFDSWKNDMSIRVASYPNFTSNFTEIPSTWIEEQGLVYTWALATNGKGGADGRGNEDADPNTAKDYDPVKQRQGICPGGWHLPSRLEWKELLKVLEEDTQSHTYKYSDYTQSNSGPVVSEAQRAANTAKSNKRLNGATDYPLGASKSADKGGFSVLLTGQGPISQTLPSYEYGGSAYFWFVDASTSPEIALGANFIINVGDSEDIEDKIINMAVRKTSALSVRCKKD